MRLLHKTLFAVVGAVALLPSHAWALSCDEIMNMVNVNVPSKSVVSTMENSGQAFTAADVSCLRSKGAPADVVQTAQRLSAAPAAAAPAPTQAQPAANPLGESLGDSDIMSLPEEGDETGVSSPSALQQHIEAYRNKKYVSAAEGLYALLEDNTFPQEKAKIEYYLAKSLYDMGMYHGAQHYFMQVVKKGPSKPYFKYALPRLVAIAEHTGNDYELLRIVAKIPPEAFPRQAKNHLYYLMGRKLYENEDLSGSSRYFQQISAKSELYMRARYFDGIINTERGKLKSAVMAFRDVMQAQPALSDAKTAREVEDLKDLALINVARIYYGLQRYESADNYYNMVDRNSTYWPESLFERAWTNFHRQDLNTSLGLLLTVQSPYFSNDEFIPEVVVLRALTYFNLCEWSEVDKILLDFETDYKPMANEIKQFLDRYKTEEGRKLADQAYDSYFGPDAPASNLHQAMFVRILRNRDLASLVQHMDMMDEEIAEIDAQRGSFRQTVGEGVKKKIAKDRQRYKRRAGIILLQEMLEYYRGLSDLIIQSEIVRFEVVDAQRVDYEFKMKNPEVDPSDRQAVDFSVSRDIIYWPFNGEFWADELGYYKYAEHGACK
jgi:tetratricopeptide (TPR) repeat protein